MNLKPLHDRVLVERVEQEDRTKGGIIMMISKLLKFDLFCILR